MPRASRRAPSQHEIITAPAVQSPNRPHIARRSPWNVPVKIGTVTISAILDMADRIVPGHFPELVKSGDDFTWEESAELPLVVR